MIKAVVAHSDPLVRAGIRSVLRASRRVSVPAETGSGTAAIAAVRRHRPDVAILDVQLESIDGIRVTRLVRQQIPSTRVLIHTAVASEECVYHSFHAGAAGFVMKGATSEELLKAVLAVAAGETVLSPAVARCVVDRFLQVDHDRVAAARRRIATLTTRERAVLDRLAQGMGNTVIAAQLIVSEGTVKAHVSHLLTKLGCANRVQAALLAHDSGVVCVQSV